MKTAIVVSGGDAPGINAAIENALRLADAAGDQVLGAQDGFAGLLAGRLNAFDPALLSLLAGRGGSVLRSSREPVLGEPDAQVRLRAVMNDHAIDNLLIFGGDGTMRHVLPILETWAVPFIALPTTIDNDVAGTDYTLGHDSACNHAIHAIEGIRATATALPGRIFMLETLGAPSGYLALAIAYASGAYAVLLPEYAYDMAWLAKRLQAVVARDGYALVVLSEAVPSIKELVEEIPNLTDIRLRYTALGHAQRGADASHRDRTVARDLTWLAMQELKSGIRHGTLVMRYGGLVLHDGYLPLIKKPPPDYSLYRRINGL